MRTKKHDTDKIILEKIIKYCDQIKMIVNKYNDSYELYQSDITFQYSANMCILQIGELTTRLSEAFKEKHSVIPWRLIKAMRNINAHDYESLNLEYAWNTLIEDIPKLKADLMVILNNYDNNDAIQQ